MIKKFLREVVTITVGKQVEEIADLLNSKNHINEFLIAKKLDITINQTRNILYKLSDFGLVSSIRKKDKKKGWYTYFWKLEILKSMEFLRGILVKKMDQLNNQIRSRESKEFYVCERCDIEFNEETALAYDFTCNECGGVFTIKDKSKDLKTFKKDLMKLERELELVDIEVNRERAILEKKKTKEIDRVKEEKLTKRRLTAKNKAAAKSKSLKKVSKLKKKTKKKVPKKKSKKKSIKKIIKKKEKKKSRKKKVPKKKSKKRR